MASVVRLPITNVYMGGDYTGIIRVGPDKKPMNVILDTGSSALALDGRKYAPELTKGDKSTDLAQTDSYGDGSSWTGAVIKTTIAVGDGDSSASLPGANASIAYQESASRSVSLPARRRVPDAQGYLAASLHLGSGSSGQRHRS